jgi:hypothetical protein
MFNYNTNTIGNGNETNKKTEKNVDDILREEFEQAIANYNDLKDIGLNAPSMPNFHYNVAHEEANYDGMIDAMCDELVASCEWLKDIANRSKGTSIEKETNDAYLMMKKEQLINDD